MKLTAAAHLPSLDAQGDGASSACATAMDDQQPQEDASVPEQQHDYTSGDTQDQAQATSTPLFTQSKEEPEDDDMDGAGVSGMDVDGDVPEESPADYALEEEETV